MVLLKDDLLNLHTDDLLNLHETYIVTSLAELPHWGSPDEVSFNHVALRIAKTLLSIGGS